jgi:hypothetical protein
MTHGLQSGSNEVARALHAPLDVLVVRKLGVPGQKELAMGAIAPGGVRVLNNEVVHMLRIPDEVINAVAARIIIAVPAAASSPCDELATEGDEIVCLIRAADILCCGLLVRALFANNRRYVTCLSGPGTATRPRGRNDEERWEQRAREENIMQDNGAMLLSRNSLECRRSI